MRHRQLFLTALFLVGCDAGGEHHAEGHIEVVMGRIPPVATAHEEDHGADKAAAAHSAAGEEAHGTAEHAAAPPEGEAAPAEGEAAPAEGEVAAEGEGQPAEGEAAEGEAAEGEVPEEPTEYDPNGEDPEPAPPAPEPEPEPAPTGGGNADELAKSAKILFGSAKVDGGLELDVVRKAIKKKKGALAKCYAQGLVKNNALTGKVTLQFNIDKKGKVADASIKSSTLGDAAVEACISAEMAGWKFDAPADGKKVKVKYPLTFNPS